MSFGISTDYSDATAVAAEGARVGFVTCMRCGATILIDPRGPDGIKQHDEFHDEMDRRLNTQEGSGGS